MIVINPLLSSLISFVVGAVGAWLIKTIKSHKEHSSDIGKGIMFLLRKDLIDRCDKLIAADEIGMSELDSIRQEYSIYKSLGGNGDVKSRMKIIEERVIRS